MDRDRTHRSPRAFSLIELVTTVAILAVLAGIAVPRYTGSLGLYRARAAAARVAADLNLARVRGRTSSVGQSVSFDVAHNAYTLPGLSGLNGPGSGAYAVSLTADPYAATLVSADFSGAASLSFDRYGQPSSGGSVVVRSGTFTKTVVVNAATGLATVP